MPLVTSEINNLVAVGWQEWPAYRRVVAIGHNSDIDTGPEDMWTGGGLYPWMTASTSLEIVSSSTADTALGTGARTVTINGLNDAYDEVSQTVSLNGTSAVSIPTPLYRINGALVVTTGSGNVNAGTLTIRDAGGGTTRALISVGHGTTQQSEYTTPAGYTLQVITLVSCINRPTSTRDATLATYIANPNGSYRLPFEYSVNGQPFALPILPGVIVPEKTDFGIRCTYVSTTNTDITAAWIGVMKLNEIPVI